MQKMQNTWVLAGRLEEAMRASSLTHAELAETASVNYYAVRRMRLDGVKNRSANAVALCKFFGIAEPDPASALSKTTLASALTSAWDGTEGQGRLILDLIRCIEQYTIEHKT